MLITQVFCFDYNFKLHRQSVFMILFAESQIFFRQNAPALSYFKKRRLKYNLPQHSKNGCHYTTEADLNCI